MGLIVSAIRRMGRFKTDVITSRLENENHINEIKLQQYRNAIKQLEVKDEVNKLELDIKYQNKLRRRSVLYNFISIIGTIGSIALTLCGITGSSFYELFSTSKNIAYSTLVIFTQFSVWVISANKHYIKEKFYNNYNKLRLLQLFTIATSIICNYMFLVSFLKPDSLVKQAFVAMMSVSVDLISLTFCSLAQDCKFRNYSYKFGKDLDDNVGLFTMIKFIMTYKLKSKIKMKYLTELNEYNQAFPQLNQKKDKQGLLNNNNTYSLPSSFTNTNTNEAISNKVENISPSSNTPITYNSNTSIPIRNNTPINNTTSKKVPLDKDTKTQKNDTDNDNDYVVRVAEDKVQLEEEKPKTKIKKSDKKLATAKKNVNKKQDDKQDKIDTTNENKTDKKQDAKMDNLSTNILNFPNYKNQTLKEYGMYETVKERLSSLDDDTMLSASKLAINPAEWKKIKERLIREDLAYEQNSRLRKKGEHHLDKVKNS